MNRLSAHTFQRLYPEASSLNQVVEEAFAQLPVTDPNILKSLLMTYHNTMVAQQKRTKRFPETELMAVVCTNCLPEQEVNAVDPLLESGEVVGANRPFGCLVHSHAQEGKYRPDFPVLFQILDKAKDAGADWVLFDGSGPVPQGFTTYDW